MGRGRDMKQNPWVWPIAVASALAVLGWGYVQLVALGTAVAMLQAQNAAHETRLDALGTLLTELIMAPRE